MQLHAIVSLRNALLPSTVYVVYHVLHLRELLESFKKKISNLATNYMKTDIEWFFQVIMNFKNICQSIYTVNMCKCIPFFLQLGETPEENSCSRHPYLVLPILHFPEFLSNIVLYWGKLLYSNSVQTTIIFFYRENVIHWLYRRRYIFQSFI